jgi:hypothetical protein
MKATQSTETPDAIGDLFREVWAGKLFVFIGAVVGVVAALTFMAVSFPHAKAQIVLAPANPLTVERVAASTPTLSGQYQAQPSSENTNFTRFESSYKGVAVANLLLKNPEITEGLKADRSFAFEDAKQNWTPEELAEYVSRRVRVDPVGETSLRSLNYYHPDAAFAVTFLQRLHAIADGLLRRDMRVQIDNRINYLNEALAGARNPEHQRALADLLLEQQRLKMMVSIDQSYAASVVVPASLQAGAGWPNAALVYSLLPLIGAFVGFVLFSAVGARRENVAKISEQKTWFNTDSGNSNIPPQRHPLTGRKAQTLRLDEDETPPSRAAK